MTDRLILASASPRRNDLLREAGYDFEIVPADVDELDDPSLDLVELTEANASLKASAVSPRFPDAIVIGADSLVFIDGVALGKPLGMDEARSMISRLAGRTHQVCTGVCLQRHADGNQRVFHDLTAVTFKHLTAEEIDGYLSMIHPLDKAGGYAAQEHGELIIARTEGSYSNVVGLPMEKLAVELERMREFSQGL